MDATTAQPTLLSAAKNFMCKSAGAALLVIAPLAAVSIAPEAKAQTIFGTPGINVGYNYGTGSALITDSFPEPNRFIFAGSASNNLTTTRLGVDGTLTTAAGGSAIVTLTIFSAITAEDIPPATVIPLTYDFTLNRTGTVSNVSWSLAAHINSDNFVNLGSGTLTTGSANFTGTGAYTTVYPVFAGVDLDFILTLNYASAAADVLAFQMNSASQGFTINAVAIPEPSTYAAILGLGALGMVVVRRSRRTAA